MKKLITTMLCILCACGMVACGGSEAKNDSNDETTSIIAKEENTQETVQSSMEDSEVAIEEESTEEVSQDSENMANPWIISDMQGVLDATGFSLQSPEGVTDTEYSYSSDGMAQLTYLDESDAWTYRVKEMSEETDISGMEYTWDSTEEGRVNGVKATIMCYFEESSDEEDVISAGGVEVLNWYDQDAGVMHSLSISSEDLNGLDIEAYAESMLQPVQ